MSELRAMLKKPIFEGMAPPFQEIAGPSGDDRQYLAGGVLGFSVWIIHDDARAANYRSSMGQGRRVVWVTTFCALPEDACRVFASEVGRQIPAQFEEKLMADVQPPPPPPVEPPVFFDD